MKQLIFLLSFFFTSLLSAQKYTISGFVSDKLTQEKLIGALVADTKSRLGTTTNSYGFYSLTLPADSVTLVYSYVGFKPVKKRILLK
ncbi:MAG: carboxypeptidase-like regulatory domain-containing protein, partial [Sphingobacteriia bacterium]|nr:carboxypeptidase-like regulatory domain-containing protein [Sphingobacteriia bacterium]